MATIPLITVFQHVLSHKLISEILILSQDNVLSIAPMVHLLTLTITDNAGLTVSLHYIPKTLQIHAK
jgi:hypothetical protein